MEYQQERNNLIDKLNEFTKLIFCNDLNSKFSEQSINLFNQLKFSAFSYVQQLKMIEILYYKWFAYQYDLNYKELKKSFISSKSLTFIQEQNSMSMVEVGLLLLSFLHVDSEIYNWIIPDISLSDLIYYHNIQSKNVFEIQNIIFTLYEKHKKNNNNIWITTDPIIWNRLKLFKCLVIHIFDFYKGDEIFDEYFKILCDFWIRYKDDLMEMIKPSYFWEPNQSERKNKRLEKQLVFETRCIEFLFIILDEFATIYSIVRQCGTELMRLQNIENELSKLRELSP